ncbi:MAG: serpin family protein [Bacteroidales bacterium]
MKNLSLLSGVLFLITSMFWACSKEEIKPTKINLPEKAGVVINAGNEFSIRLFKETALSENGNMMISPYSASAALTMLLNGCKENTLEQISQILGFQNLTQTQINEVYNQLTTQLLAADPEIKLAIANAAFYHQQFSVKPPFINTLKNDFGANVQALDFRSQEALRTINQWASDHTFEKIPKVLDEISPDAVMFILNALYFKGQWTYKFDKDKTAPGLFTLENGSPKEVLFMHGEFPVKTLAGENYRALEMSYGRGNFVMDIIIPENSMTAFLQSFSPEVWNEVSTGFDEIQAAQNMVMVPRFSFSYEKILNDPLQALGMVDAFNPALANLSGISDENIFVSFVKQNTFIDVNEEGTEAAAVTTIGIELTSVPDFFAVDRPFIFAIREQTTNTLLFMGRVMEP